MRLDVDQIDEIALAFVEAVLQDPELVRFVGTAGGTSRARASLSAYSESRGIPDNNDVELLATKVRSNK